MGSCLHTGNDGRDLEDNFTRSCAEHCGGLAGSLDQGSGRRTDRRAPSLPENRSRSGIRTIRWHPQSASAVRSAQSAVAKGYSFCHSAANDVHLTAMWRCWSFFLLAIIIAYPEAVHAVNRNKRAREDGCLETVRFIQPDCDEYCLVSDVAFCRSALVNARWVPYRWIRQLDL